MEKDQSGIIHGVAKGNEENLRQLLDVYHDPLYRYLYRISYGSSECEDLLQEVFMRVVQSAPHYKGKSTVKTWIYAIATNVAREYRRKKQVHSLSQSEIDAIDDSMPTVETLEKEETQTAILAALSRLPEKQQEAVILKTYDELSYEEIGVIMNIEASSVGSLLSRAYENLQKFLKIPN